MGIFFPNDLDLHRILTDNGFEGHRAAECAVQSVEGRERRAARLGGRAGARDLAQQSVRGKVVLGRLAAAACTAHIYTYITGSSVASQKAKKKLGKDRGPLLAAPPPR